ncbi:MAG TPA: transcription antitermination factor NusB, partial [Anaerolineae bacterium]|nr:transcription antitermination factor NusB [Anaerolineae bacterium]
MQVRRCARITVLQALYEIDIAHHQPDEVLANRLREVSLPQAGQTFVRRLLSGILRHQAILDETIARYAPEWPIDQMAAIDRNILRIALFEMASDMETPVKVAINEAVELSKMFGSESSPRFVNGV